MTLETKNKRVFLLGGPGGVGKTTLAASLGVQFAKAGYKTVVLTVDPARRLAQALGLKTFSFDLQPVPLEGQNEPKLFASMLDTQRYFDKLISRFALSDEQRDRVLNHRFYRIMVDHLGGTHEYAAMERLLEFAEGSEFEKIIVDTPPSQNAADLLSAPQRLAAFMDNSVLKWFQGQKPVFALFRHGTKAALKLLEKIFGSEFLQSLGEVLTDFDGMQAGFRKRHLQVIELLKSSSTSFLLVTYPSEARFLETREFLSTIKSQGISLSGIILNRIEAPAPKEVSAANLSQDDAARISAILGYYSAMHAQQAIWVAEFEKTMRDLPIFKIERRNTQVHDLSALADLTPFQVDLKDDTPHSSS
jgi:anion-transporting  ArsA/GET3 family ATPase